LLGEIEQLVELLFDLDVRHHLTADLAEAREPVGDGEEAVLIDRREIAGVIPAVAQDLGGLLRLAEIAQHDARSFDFEQTRLIESAGLAGLGMHDAHRDARQRMSDLATLGADLAEARRAEITSIHADHRRAFRSSITLIRTN